MKYYLGELFSYEKMYEMAKDIHVLKNQNENAQNFNELQS